jgi:hypothetical protein
MNPKHGEAVMATLAVACAENEGFQVVTEFPELHGELIGTPREAILKACLEEPRGSGETSGRQIAEFLVYRGEWSRPGYADLHIVGSSSSNRKLGVCGAAESGRTTHGKHSRAQSGADLVV